MCWMRRNGKFQKKPERTLLYKNSMVGARRLDMGNCRIVKVFLPSFLQTSVPCDPLNLIALPWAHLQLAFAAHRP